MAVAGWRVMLVGSHNKQRTDCLICTVTALFSGEDTVLRVVKVKVFFLRNLPDLSNIFIHWNLTPKYSQNDGPAKSRFGAIIDISNQGF